MSDLAAAADQGPAPLALYDRALPEVYGYLLRRCDGASVAEDLTAETFLAAVSAVQTTMGCPSSSGNLHPATDPAPRAAQPFAAA